MCCHGSKARPAVQNQPSISLLLKVHLYQCPSEADSQLLLAGSCCQTCSSRTRIGGRATSNVFLPSTVQINETSDLVQVSLVPSACATTCGLHGSASWLQPTPPPDSCLQPACSSQPTHRRFLKLSCCCLLQYSACCEQHRAQPPAADSNQPAIKQSATHPSPLKEVMPPHATCQTAAQSS